MQTPLVSVITPSLNAARFIEETIESVLAQTYDPIELVIADGGSTDGTLEIIDGFAREHPGRVRLLTGHEEHGPWRRRNEALLASQGSLVCWLDLDDIWMPEKVERQVELMRARPELGMVYSHFEAFDSDSGTVLEWEDAEHDWEGDLLAPLWVKGCFVGALTVMLRREALDERAIRLGNEGFMFGDDYWQFLAVSLDWPSARIDEVLARYRRHDGNQSSRWELDNPTANLIPLMRKFLEVYPEADGRLGRWKRTGLARNYFRAAAFERERGNKMLAWRFKLRGMLIDRGASREQPVLDELLVR
jgi:teichuronic acid biosynthesis glycosyltransferase TuaG